VLTYFFIVLGVTVVYGLSSWALILLILFGSIVGLAPGWGKYFHVDSVGKYYPEEKEVWIIDQMIKPFPVEYQRIIGMSLRWFVCFLPLFIILGNPMVFGLLAIGPMYRIQELYGKYMDYNTKWFVLEFTTGTWLGYLLLIGGVL
tara:strand:+ start:1954 stop:2388 length:435 start_codon:yes stop_codon:yes gene_type:complete